MIQSDMLDYDDLIEMFKTLQPETRKAVLVEIDEKLYRIDELVEDDDCIRILCN